MGSPAVFMLDMVCRNTPEPSYARSYARKQRNGDAYTGISTNILALSRNHDGIPAGKLSPGNAGRKSRDSGATRERSGRVGPRGDEAHRSFCITSRPSAAVDSALGCMAQWVMMHASLRNRDRERAVSAGFFCRSLWQSLW